MRLHGYCVSCWSLRGVEWYPGHEPSGRIRQLCRHCHDRLRSLAHAQPHDRLGLDVVAGDGGGWQRLTLFAYRGLLRELILRVKVQGDMQAMNILQQLLLSAEAARTLVCWAEVIIPSPSSLWGRLRGRLDLAYALAQGAAALSGSVLVLPPWSLSWRRYKRAQLALGQRAALVPGSYHRRLGAYWQRGPGQVVAGRRLLVLDDVTTSGTTLMETSQALAMAGSREIRLLALAGRNHDNGKL